MKKEIIKKLIDIVGKERVMSSDEDRICYSYDATGKMGIPDVVVKPKTADEVSAIVKIANREKIPVVPRGAGSGFVGGSIPIHGGIALVMTDMNCLIELDEENMIAVVEPGMVTYNLQQEVEKRGLFYPPDPASLKICTIGGNAATCAGGPRALKYGVTKDYILGLDAVLPDGEILHAGVKTAKGVVGYDLTKLMVGSEGTLGVITKINLKLLPLPEKIKTALAVFPKIDDASIAVSKIIASRILPSSLEFMDQSAVKCVEDYIHAGLPTDAEALLLIEVDGDEISVERQIEKIGNVCSDTGARDVKIAKDEAERESIWKARRAISPALGHIAPTKINEDITVPRNKVPDIIRRLKNIAERYKLNIVNFGHAGDGNLHVNIMTDRRNTEEMKRADEAVSEIFSATLELGGTISGEHGIGITKSRYIKDELGVTGIEVTKKIKRVFDPDNIMNPGKIL
ncbi:MAG: FAD-binding protein [Nitrospinae bacterium]|nr:FAD-binding protein [Nitrospinota bacterium]MBI3814066.1 FAD-binding protein [Nitrospinota bacterium]